MNGMSVKLISYGLQKVHLKDAETLAETALLVVFRDEIKKGKTQELLNLLNGHQAQGKIAFILNFLAGLFQKSMEEKLMLAYKLELTDKLQLNSTSAEIIAQTVMPAMLKLCVEVFSKTNTNAVSLAKMVNDGLPFDSSID
jgi:hypothetical protein